MRRLTPFMQSFSQLPDSLPVFPLANAVVLPGGVLPLNIFEPRYLNMLRDAMESHRLIGMIQPRDDSSTPELYEVGCAGRVTRYQETGDGRLEIALTGLCRFRIKQEVSTTRGYRLVVPDWSEYAIDFEEPEEAEVHEKSRFKGALLAYLKNSGMDVDWNLLEQLTTEELTNSLVSALPLKLEDRQLLIETDNHLNRLRAFTVILEGGDEVPAVRH